MKKLLLSLFTICLLPSSILHCFGQFSSQNITLLSHWDTVSTIAEPIYNIRYNSVWGWKDPQDNKEYAILGSTDGTYFIDVTIPTAPVVKDFVVGPRDSCIWREYKTYQNYLYMVSDDQVKGNNRNALQIIDLSPLPDSVHVVYDADTLIVRSHTVMIDGDKMYCGYVHYDKTNFGNYYSMAVYSLANPVLPVFLRSLNQDDPSIGVVHDMFCRNDTVYASCGNSGLYIYKLTASNTFSPMGSVTNYEPGGAYNHSVALTQNGKAVIFCDEQPPNLKVKSLDVSNFSNLTIVDKFQSYAGTTATPHNIFIREGNNSRVTIAYYQDGVQIFDISNPASVTRTGFFDCAPTNCPACPNPNYSGCWGTYVDLPSGIILASDMQDGLFVLDASAALNTVQNIVNEVSVDVFPNPFTTNFQLNFSLAAAEKISYELADITGKIIMRKEISVPAGKSPLTIDGKNLSSGAYMLTVKGETISLTKKIIKTNK